MIRWWFGHRIDHASVRQKTTTCEPRVGKNGGGLARFHAVRFDREGQLACDGMASRVRNTLPVGKPQWPLKTVSFSAGNNWLRFLSICTHKPYFFAVAACKHDSGSC